MHTSVVESSSLSSPLCAVSRRAGNHDNSLPSVTLHAARPIPSTIEEDPVPSSLCQQTTVEIHTDAPLQCRDVVFRTAVRSRPVTSRQPRASVRGRTISMPSSRPVNIDVANDISEHHVLRVIPPIPAPATAKIGLGQMEEVDASDDYENVQEISISSQGDNGASSSAAISISYAPIAGSRRMSHVTPDFNPPPPRRFDLPLPVVAPQQVRATSRMIHHDDRRALRPNRTRDVPDPACSKAELDEARRRYFSIAEWNRQKVLHLRRGSLRRACLTGIPFSWTQRSDPADRRQSRDGATTKCRRRQTSRNQTTTDSATGSECRKPQSMPAEIQSNVCRNQSLPPISESSAVTANSGRATRRCGTMKSEHQQNPALNKMNSVQRQAMSYTGRCPPITIPTAAHHARPSYSTSHRTLRSVHKELEVNEKTVTASAQQKPEAYDSGLDSDANTRTTAEYQSLPAANVDLQKVKDVLEHPPSRGRTHKDDVDNDEVRDIKITCDSNDNSSNNCKEHVEMNGNYDQKNTRLSVDLPRFEACHDDDEHLMKEAMDVMSTKILGLSRKQSVPSGDCRGSYIYRVPGRRTTDFGLPTFDSKSSTPALLEPVDLVTDCSRPVSSMSSSIAVDEITSLPGSPFYRQVLQRRSSSIDSSIMSRPGSDLLDVPIFFVQPRDRSPSMVSDIETPSAAESPTTSPVCIVTEERDLQQQVVHRLSDAVQLPPVTPYQSPDHTEETGADQDTTQRCGVAIDVPLVQAPQVSLTTDDGDDFDVWFGRRGSIFIEERGATQRQMFLAQQTTRNAKGQVSLAVPKPTADN